MKRYTQMNKTQMLTGNLVHFKVGTPDIIPTGDSEAPVGSFEFNNFYEQARVWERLIEVIRTRANVVIVSDLSATGFSVAVEHDVTQTSGLPDEIDVVAELQTKMRDLGQVPFGSTMVEVDDEAGRAPGDVDYVTTEEAQPATVDLSGVTVTEAAYNLV